jgi:hypothetical protein
MAKVRDCHWQIRHWKRFNPVELLQDVLQVDVPRVLRLAEWPRGRSRNDGSLRRNAFRRLMIVRKRRSQQWSES